MRRETLVELAAHYGVPLPPVGDYNSFTEFSAIYEAVCAVLRTHNDLRRLVREVVEDAAESGAVWLEMGVRPTLHRDKFASDAEVLEILLDEGQTAGQELGARRRGAHDRGPHPTPWHSDGGGSARRRLRRQGCGEFRACQRRVRTPAGSFRRTVRRGSPVRPVVVSARGELDGADSVRSALDTLGADRIQHGIRAIEDPELVRRLANDGICLDVCPTSNICLKVIPSVEEHPLPLLLEAGIPCSLNGDDPLFFGANLLDEYELCRDKLDLSDEQLARVARASIESSGAPAALKASTCANIDAWLSDPVVS